VRRILGQFLRRIFVVGGCVAVSACGSESTPTSPDVVTSALNLTGTFSGNASDSSGPGRMTWLVTQTGSTINGTMTAATPSGAVQFRGNLSGTLAGSILQFVVDVPVGGVSGLPSCAVRLSGSAPGVTNSTISGTYSGTNTCTAPFTNGRFTLTKQ
jgi:hypothetical protein